MKAEFWVAEGGVDSGPRGDESQTRWPALSLPRLLLRLSLDDSNPNRSPQHLVFLNRTVETHDYGGIPTRSRSRGTVKN